jgi:hypothetical protein
MIMKMPFGRSTRETSMHMFATFSRCPSPHITTSTSAFAMTASNVSSGNSTRAPRRVRDRARVRTPRANRFPLGWVGEGEEPDVEIP